jgi:hypothetical protein
MRPLAEGYEECEEDTSPALVHYSLELYYRNISQIGRVLAPQDALSGAVFGGNARGTSSKVKALVYFRVFRGFRFSDGFSVGYWLTICIISP